MLNFRIKCCLFSLFCCIAAIGEPSDSPFNSPKVEGGFSSQFATPSLAGFQLSGDYPVLSIDVKGPRPIYMALGGTFNALFRPEQSYFDFDAVLNFYYPIIQSEKLGIRFSVPLGLTVQSTRFVAANELRFSGNFGFAGGLYYFFAEDVGVFGNLGFTSVFDSYAFIPFGNLELGVVYAF